MEKSIFNDGKVLNEVRKGLGYSLDEVVFCLNNMYGISISKQALSRFERGLLNIRVEVIKAMSKMYGYPFDIERETSFRTYRRLSADDTKKLKSHIAQMRIYAAEKKAYEDQIGLSPFAVPDINMSVSSFEDVDKYAEKLREYWKLGEAPISNIHNFLEHKGIAVYGIEEKIDGFHGLCIEGNESAPPSILFTQTTQLNYVRNNISVVRKRSTLLHELAHLIIPFDKGCDSKTIEDLCTSFVGAFLIPRHIMKELFVDKKDFSILELLAIKAVWGVSIQVLLYTAKNRGFINNAILLQAKKNIKASSNSNDGHILYEPDEIPQSKFMNKEQFRDLTYQGHEKSYRMIWLKEYIKSKKF